MGEWFYFMSRPRVVTGKRLFYAQFDFNSILLLFVCLLFVFFVCKIIFIHPALTSYRRFTSTPCCCTAKISTKRSTLAVFSHRPHPHGTKDCRRIFNATQERKKKPCLQLVIKTDSLSFSV